MNKFLINNVECILHLIVDKKRGHFIIGAKLPEEPKDSPNFVAKTLSPGNLIEEMKHLGYPVVIPKKERDFINVLIEQSSISNEAVATAVLDSSNEEVEIHIAHPAFVEFALA
jgi:hypothetical protein